MSELVSEGQNVVGTFLHHCLLFHVVETLFENPTSCNFETVDGGQFNNCRIS